MSFTDKIVEARKRREAIRREMETESLEARLLATDREIAQLEEQAAAEAERARLERVAVLRAERAEAEKGVLAETRRLADALATLGEVEDRLRLDGEGLTARSGNIPNELREAVRHALGWWEQFRPRMVGLEPRHERTPEQSHALRLGTLEALLQEARSLPRSAEGEDRIKDLEAAIQGEHNHWAGRHG